MLLQCNGIEWVETAFLLSWRSYEAKNWNFDGATFVRENNNNFWEVAAFVHDWLNKEGYVGKEPDLYFIKIMMALNYSENLVFERAKWMQWTWLNVLWHKIKRTFKANRLPNQLT